MCKFSAAARESRPSVEVTVSNRVFYLSPVIPPPGTGLHKEDECEIIVDYEIFSGPSTPPAHPSFGCFWQGPELC